MLVNGNGQCLAVNGGSTADGARILGYRCTGSTDQYWYSVLVEYNNYRFFNMKSRKVIGVAGGSTANGAAVVQWRSGTGRDQGWYMG